MSLLRWSVLGGFTVSVAMACGSSDGTKAPRVEPTGGQGGSGTAGEPAAGAPSPGTTGGGAAGDGSVSADMAGAGGAEVTAQAGSGDGGAAVALGGAGGAGGEGGPGANGCVAVKALGGHIYYSTLPTSGDGELRVATPAGDTKLLDGQNPKLSPDGKYLAFQTGRRSVSDMSTADLWMRDMVAGTQKVIFTNGDHQVGYAFNNTNDKLLYDYGCGQYIMNVDGTGGSTLFQVDCYDDAPNVQPVAPGTIAYHNQSGIQLRDSAYANPKLLTNSIAGDYWPTYSPDGQWLTFCRYTAATKLCAFQKIANNGDSLTHLGDSVNANNAAFSADGSKIVTGGLVEGASGLHVFAADGSGYLGTVCGASTSNVELVGSITAD